MTMDEIEAMIAERPNRTAVIVFEDRDEFIAEWDGVEYRDSNPFGLDSKMTYAGVPSPRDFYLFSEGY